MRLMKRLKGNLFLIFVILAYLVMFVARPEMGVASVTNSAYYIKEMLMIMPPIFVLTALLDLWLPKEKVLRLLGKDAGMKGIALSFLLGSVSAGPVYAAFPMGVMLHNKGASIRNIVVILSSWAVIKIPMLINEAKFLGLKFMMIRWVLTVIAIIIFSWITDKIVSDEDLPEHTPSQTGPSLNRHACMGCGLCARQYPELFEMDGKKAGIKECAAPDATKLLQIIEACPVKAISN